MAAFGEEENFYVQLSKNPIRFEPVSKVNGVFFDDSNRQVFAVRSGGAAGVVVKGQDEKKNINFRMEDRGEVISIKFSCDMKVLAIQRSQKSVEFVNFADVPDSAEYSQSCKGKSTKIIGFNWTNINEIVFITDNGIEFYQVIPEKKQLKLSKAYSISVQWFVWLAQSSVLLLSSGASGNVIHPFYFRAGNMTKMAKFEVEMPAAAKPPKPTLLERDVTMAVIYGQLHVVLLRHQPRSGTTMTGAEIVLYQIQKDGPARKSDILRLDMSGRFAINIVDNLVVVHHQASKTTMVFDIKLGGDADSSYITYHRPVLAPLPIKPFQLMLPTVPTSIGAEVQKYNCELYSPNWIVFQPNVVIDAKLGCMWYVQLRLDPLISMMPDKSQLVDFLLLRKDSKPVLLTVCRQMLTPGQQASLPTIANIFDKLNKVYQSHLDTEIQALATDNSPFKTDSLRRKQPIVDQSDMYTHVFSIFVDNKEIPYKFMVAVLVEYIRSLNLYQIAVQACLMLSLESVYPPAYQLALDMLKRLSTANDEIVEVLLSKQQLLPALRFVRSYGGVDQISARKFLETAKNTGDDMIFYTVYKFFEQRNIRLRSMPRFPPGEHCEQYARHFETLFGVEALAHAAPGS